MLKTKNNTLMNFTPAWDMIPDVPENSDLEGLLNNLDDEMDEVTDAFAEYTLAKPRSSEAGKAFAHLGEEVCDVMIRCWTILNLMEQMSACPIKDFAQITALFCHLKNKRRGYLGSDKE